MTQKEYRVKVRSELYRALIKTSRELKETFRIVNISFDENNKEFIYSIEASNNFHNKLASYF
jgi:hypothetical protein